MAVPREIEIVFEK